MIFFLKYWHLIAIASLVGLLGVQKIYTDNKYHSLEKEINGIKTKALQDTIDLQSATIDYQTSLFNENFKIMDDFRNDLQKINVQHNVNLDKLNSVYKTIDTNRSYFDTASKASIVSYTNTLSDLFKGCGSMVTERSVRADEATSAAVTYHNMLITNYEASKKLAEDLKAKGFDVKVISSDSVENK